MKKPDGADQLVQYRASQLGFKTRLVKIHLEQARQLHLAGEGLQTLGDRSVLLRIVAEFAIQRLELFHRRLQDRRRARALWTGSKLADQVVGRLNPGDRQRQLANQHLVVHQRRQVLAYLVVRELRVGVVENARQLRQKRAVLRSFQDQGQVIGRLDRGEVIGARLVVEARFHVTKPLRGRVQARIGAVSERLSDLGISIEALDHRGQVIHVEPGMPQVVGARADHQLRLRGNRSQRTASEKPKGRGAGAQASKVANQS